MDYLDNVLAHIKEEIKKVDYGKITIELRESSDKVDIVTEKRYRISKK